MDEQDLIESAQRFLKSQTTGDLRFDEHYRPLRYVIGPAGRIVAPVMTAMLQAQETVLFVPEVVDGAMELLVTLTEFDADGPEGALTDRWRIYHGEPEDVYWAFFDLDAVRFHDSVIDGEALVRPNPLASDEARICREVNAEHREDLKRVCDVIFHAEVADPYLVGVDPLGFDVRRRFDVLRLNAPQPIPTADDVQRVLKELIDKAANVAEDSMPLGVLLTLPPNVTLVLITEDQQVLTVNLHVKPRDVARLVEVDLFRREGLLLDHHRVSGLSRHPVDDEMLDDSANHAGLPREVDSRQRGIGLARQDRLAVGRREAFDLHSLGHAFGHGFDPLHGKGERRFGFLSARLRREATGKVRSGVRRRHG